MLPKRLINSVGGRFSAELGVDLSGADSGQIFRWFLASKLMGARIATKTALAAYKEFERRGVNSPERIRKTGWDGLVEILDAGGYVRYDFSTATKLLSITGDLLRLYGGDLNVLHAKSRDPRDLEERLKELGKGIGDVTVNIFLRELRTVWEKARPALSPLVLLAAGHLNLLRPGEDPLPALERFWAPRKFKGRDFSDFEAALLRLAKDYCRKRRCSACPMGDECAVRDKYFRDDKAETK